MSARNYQRLEWMSNYATQQKVHLKLCPDCGAVTGDQEVHDRWHDKVGAATMGFGGLLGL